MGKIPDQTGVGNFIELPDFENDINGQVLNYLNNPLIRGRGQNIGYTKEHILEIIKCKNDIFYFAENYYKIIHPDLGTININLRDYQKVMLQTYVDNRYSILRTSRQIGKCFYTNSYIKYKKDNIEYETTVGDFYSLINTNQSDNKFLFLINKVKKGIIWKTKRLVRYALKNLDI